MFVLIVICFITFADQLTKSLIALHLAHHETLPVIPGFFNLAHVHNTGAAFSIFNGSNVPLAIFSTVILAVLVIFRKRLFAGPSGHRLAVAMIAAGIIGNLLDRLKFASVVDLFDFCFGTYHFPTFNVADSSICIGVAIYVVSNLFVKHDVDGPGNTRDVTPAEAAVAPRPDNSP